MTISILLNVAIAALCVWGCVSSHYRDNFGERLGMVVVAMTCIVRAGMSHEFQIAERSDLWLEAGLLVFGLSMATAKIRAARKRMRPVRHAHQAAE